MSGGARVGRQWTPTEDQSGVYFVESGLLHWAPWEATEDGSARVLWDESVQVDYFDATCEPDIAAEVAKARSILGLDT